MRLVAPYALLALGLSQMAGDLLKWDWLRGLGAASTASPAPKVFTSVRGFETFSTQFFLEWERTDGSRVSHRLDSKLYSRLRGPYNRRNVYGAALAYGPVLPERLRDSVLYLALCEEAPLLRELGLEDDKRKGEVSIRYVTRPGLPVLESTQLVIRAPCI